MFAEERPALLPLPVAPFRYYEFGKRTVHLDGCVEVEGGRYGPPPGNIGRELDIQWDGAVVRLLDQGMHYAEISHRTGASTATITRIAQWLHHGEGGYLNALARLRASTTGTATGDKTR